MISCVRPSSVPDTTADTLSAVGRETNKETFNISATYDSAAWYDVALAYDNGDFRFYVNGSLVGSDTKGKVADGITGIHVGTDQGAGDPWKGVIDELVTFDSALAEADIQNLQDRTGGAANTAYFEYNAANLVKSLVTPDHTTYFHYDGNLQRYAIEEDGAATYYVWDGLRLLETRNANGTLKARFSHGLAKIEGIGSCVEVYRASDAKRFYMLYDHRGSAHVLLDESKTVVASRLYNAFGEIISQTGSWPSEVPFGYQSNWLALDGMTLPDGTRLYLSPTRIHHPGVGRFLQRDPLMEARLAQWKTRGNGDGQWVGDVWGLTELRHYRDLLDELMVRVLRLLDVCRALGSTSRASQAVASGLDVQRVAGILESWRVAVDFLRNTELMGTLDVENAFAYAQNTPPHGGDPTGLKDFLDCLACCVEKWRWEYTSLPGRERGSDVAVGTSAAAHTANATANALTPPVRAGLGGAAHPTSWQHATAGAIGRRLHPLEGAAAGQRAAGVAGRSGISHVGRFLGRLAVLVTILEGFYDIGVIAYCAELCKEDKREPETFLYDRPSDVPPSMRIPGMAARTRTGTIYY